MDHLTPLRPEPFVPHDGGGPTRTIYCVRVGDSRPDGSYETDWFASSLRRDAAMGGRRVQYEIFRMDVPAAASFSAISAAVNHAAATDAHLNEVHVPTAQIDVNLSALFRLRPGEDPEHIRAALERALQRVIEGGLLESIGAADRTVWEVRSLSPEAAALDVDTAKAGIQTLIDDGEFDQDDMAMRLAKYALYPASQMREELVERFANHAEELREQDEIEAAAAAAQRPGSP